tara:strand:+ start:818 stop:1396 length:579 start_codon:yes stop_codon:yes gene_type:complete
MKNKKYSILSVNDVRFKEYKITPLRKIDIQKIRLWRNNQINILRQNVKLSARDQIKYYNNIVGKSFFQKKPKLILFSFLLKNSCIGYGGFVHINWEKNLGEISFLLDTNRGNKVEIYKKEFRIFLRLIFGVDWKQLGFKKIVAETYNIRPNHVKVLENFGFKYQKRRKKDKLIDGKVVDTLIHEYRLKIKKV